MNLNIVNQRLQNQKMIKASSQQLLKIISMFKDIVGKVQYQLKTQLQNLSVRLKRQIELVIKKLAIRLQKSIQFDFTYSHIPYEYDFGEAQSELLSAFKRIEENMNKSMMEYLERLLNFNVFKNASTPILHSANTIVTSNMTWMSVTSKTPLIKCEIQVEGFDDLKTTYLALGVSTNQKIFGPCKSLQSEQFTGCIYLNGKSQLQIDKGDKLRKANYSLTTISNKTIKFVIQDCQRRLYIHRDDSFRKQIMILEDNTDYYMFIAWRGPIKIRIK